MIHQSWGDESGIVWITNMRVKMCDVDSDKDSELSMSKKDAHELDVTGSSLSKEGLFASQSAPERFARHWSDVVLTSSNVKLE